MVYQGSKSRILKYILPIIQSTIDNNKIEDYYEFFVGGANVIDSINCKNKYGSDVSDELIALLTYMKDNPKISIAPQDCSFEHYADVRESRKNKDGRYSKEYIALIGYFASYGGRFFDGGYGKDPSGKRNIYRERLNVALRQAPKLKGINFKCCSWEDYKVEDFNDCMIYCFDKETEILTKNGWKNIGDCTLDDYCLSREPNTSKLEWVKVVNLISYKYKGKMYKYDGKNVDLCVIPNHRMFISKYNKKNS